MACLASRFAPASLAERTADLYSPETRHRYETRQTHLHHSLVDFVKERADEYPSAVAAGLQPLRYAKMPVRVEAFGRTEFFEVAAVKGWAEALKREVEARFAVRCDGLAFRGRALDTYKPLDLVGAPPYGIATVSIVGVMRQPLASASAGSVVPWSDFRARVIARLCADLPRVLAALAPAAGESRVEAARNFVFTRGRAEPYMRALLRNPSLTAVYGRGGDDGQAAWFGAEFASTDHADAARHDSVRAANDRFVSEYAIGDEAIAKMASNLAEQTLEALGAQLSSAVDVGTTAPPDEAHMRKALRAHFAAIGAEGSFVLHADHCGCARKRGGGGAGAKVAKAAAVKAAPPALEAAPPPPLEEVAAAGAELAAEMPALVPIGDAVRSAAMPALVPIGTKMPALVRISRKKTREARAPALTIERGGPSLSQAAPLGADVASDSDSDADVASGSDSDSDAESALGSDAAPAPAAAAPLVAVSIDNFKRFAAEYAASRSFDTLIALAPIDSQFTAAHAAKFAAMSAKERSAAMAHYMAPDPGQRVRKGAPVAVRTYAGREFALAHESGVKLINGLARPAIIDRVALGENLVAYTHDNLIGA